jgi:D-3-phosphoglycerate dehydrogenase
MVRILANDTIATSAVEKLEELGFEVVHNHYDNEELLVQIKNFDCIIVRSGTKVRDDVIDAAKETGRLKLIVRGGVGVDNINVKYAEENGIIVKNTPNASSNSVAELAIGHMFSILRYINISNVTMKNSEWNKKQYKGYELNNKTLGLYGFGRIGQLVAKKANALGMNVIYNTRSGKKPGFDQFKYVEKEELYKESDIISLHVPFVKSQGAVLTEKEFSIMKKGVYIINIARGGVVSEDSLLDAINSGIVAGAALDVFENEPTTNKAILECDKISLTPHIGASTYEAQIRIGEEIFSVVRDFFNK